MSEPDLTYQWEPDENKPWDGDGPAHVLRVPLRLQRPLYVIRFREFASTPMRELSPEERLAGWFEYEGKCVNEGHQGRGHHATHVLTWNLRAGDQVVLRLDVEFWGHTTYRRHADRWSDKPEQVIDQHHDLLRAEYSREVVGGTPYLTGGTQRFLAYCESVLGRSVGLGEDGAEEAFGHDRIETAIQDGLAFDFAGKYLCRLILRPEEKDISFDELCAKMYVTVTPNASLRSRREVE